MKIQSPEEEIILSDATIAEFKKSLRGELILRNDPHYEEARKLYNGMIDKRPLLIARCVDVADVIAAVNFGRDQGLLIAIRGGGHNGPGLGSCNDGLVIDLSMTKSVRVDPASQTVRVDAGCTSGDVDHATHAFGLAVPFGIVSTTGVAGLTVGGGTGYLTRKYGLTIDNLLEADVVLANGNFVTASKSQHPDLFWALRGGGGNFGVVTSFLFQAHPVGTVYAGPIFWEATHAKTVMRAYRDFLATAPEELGAFVGLKTVPSMDPFPKDYWGRRACAVISSYNGSAEEGEKIMARLLNVVPPPIFNWMSAMPFPAMQALFDPFLSEGPAVVLEGRLCQVPTGRGDRHAYRTSRAGAERVVAHAPLPDRRSGPPRAERRDRMEYTRRHLVHGHCWDRRGPEASRRLEDVGARLLDGDSPVQPRRSLYQFHDGRRGPGARPGHLRRKLQTSRVCESAVRSRKPLSGQPEHSAGRLLTPGIRRLLGKREIEPVSRLVCSPRYSGRRG